MTCCRFPPLSTTTQGGALADLESEVLIAADDPGRFQIHALRLSTTSTGPQMRLLIGGVVNMQTVAPTYVVDFDGGPLHVEGQEVAIDAVGGTGDGNWSITIQRM